MAVVFQKLSDSRSQEAASDSAGEKEPQGTERRAKRFEAPSASPAVRGWLLWISRSTGAGEISGLNIPIRDPAWQRISLPDPSVHEIFEFPYIGKHLLGALVAVFGLKLQAFLQDLV